MIIVPFFAISTAFGFTKNLLSFPFQAPVFFDLMKEVSLQYLLHILHLIHKQGFPFQWKTVLSELPVNKKFELVST